MLLLFIKSRDHPAKASYVSLVENHLSLGLKHTQDINGGRTLRLITVGLGQKSPNSVQIESGMRDRL